MSRENVDQAIETMEDLAIVLDAAPSSARVLALCRKHRLSVYDALYLDLSLRENAELATLDAALARAARSEGVRVA
jgi:predicted nucleic acid-binding protein